MAPGGNACDWTSDPNDKIALIAFFKTIKDKIGQGGSWDQTCLELAAAHMVSRGPPAKGAPKNANSVKGIWAGMKKIHDALVLVIQKRYPGVSGWTYDQQAGFSVCDDNREAWKDFSKQHTVFKPFANKGWEFFDDVKDILPTRARGMNVFNPTVAATTPSQNSNGGSQLNLPEFDDYNFDFPDPSQLHDSQSQSQPFTDWSQTQFGLLQPTDEGLTQPVASTLTHTPTPPLVPAAPGLARVPRAPIPVAPVAPQTPSGGVKRAASDEFQTPWTAKKGKVTGPDALLAIGGSVDCVGNAIRDCFMPQKSSAVSPTKQVDCARQMAVDDQDAGALTSRERTLLNLIFTKDPKAADVYVAEKTSEGRSALAEILIERF
ncbi:hypothetical protein B0H11DRAFT_2346286 [Mycena galericulata]|nr:hypothetical protein B0H11DRAFT_2346286 [Mycena galericulata]